MEANMTQAHDFIEGTPVGVLTTEPVSRLFDYLAPAGGVSVGDLVKVPLGPRRVLGVVWGKGTGFDPSKLRPISTVSDAPPMTPDMLDFVVGFLKSKLDDEDRAAVESEAPPFSVPFINM